MGVVVGLAVGEAVVIGEAVGFIVSPAMTQ